MAGIVHLTWVIMSWFWGLWVVAFVAPGPVLNHYLAMFAVGLVMRLITGKVHEDSNGPVEVMLGFTSLASLILWGYTWHKGWPEGLRWTVFYVNLFHGPVLIFNLATRIRY